jgi:26S proteasome regulatory subunit N7
LQAAALFLDCVATFTCTELCSYKQFMFYALLTCLIALDRNDLRKKAIDDPHVITVVRDLPQVQLLLTSIYGCDYISFFKAVRLHTPASSSNLSCCSPTYHLLTCPSSPPLSSPLLQILAVHPDILADRFLGRASVYLVREYRVLAYGQFLEAYRSVMLSSMAASFGISTTMLDAELSRFIAAGRLNAKIDKVGDIIETSRPDKKNAQYQDVIKKGDILLNQIQKLVRAIDV